MEDAVTAVLRKHGVPEAMDEVLVAGGMLTRSKLAASLKTPEIAEKWMRLKVFTPGVVQGVELESWEFSEAAGAFRLAHEELCKPAGDKLMGEGSGQPLAEALSSAVHGKKLKDPERLTMISALQKKRGGEAVPLYELPALCFLQLVWRMAQEKDFRWVPWKHTVSQEAATLTSQATPQGLSSESQLVRLLAKERCLEDPEEVDVTGTNFRVSSIMRCRAFAFAMCGMGSLAAWMVYVNRFVALYTKRPKDTGLRSPSLEEAEEADLLVWMELLQLVVRGDNWEDSLFELVVTRDLLATSLRPQLKVKQEHKEEGSGAKRSGDQQGRGRRVRPRRGAARDQNVKEDGDKDKARKKGWCWKHMKGKCMKGEDCEFRHA